jgi:hypothetical protein
MSTTEAQAKTDEDSVVRMREVSVSRYPGREPVTVRTTRVPGEDPSREERMRAGLRRMLLEGRISLLD